MTNEELCTLLNQTLPNTLVFRTEGGLQGKPEISGTLEDILKFDENIWEDGAYGGEIE